MPCFISQYDLCDKIDTLINEVTKGKPGDWRSIVSLYVIEHLGERARNGPVFLTISVDIGTWGHPVNWPVEDVREVSR